MTEGGIASPFPLSLPALSTCHCEPKAWQSQESRKAKLKDQNDEGFLLLNCNFNFLSLIFDFVRGFLFL